ncbi:DUF6084 family protein [Streptomyces sp. TRM 70361]|uniref:DUF6084 family protein n=1 Tax=Streptomyces sp. TRM 70361 TaxID=3116553 RepID=UPI002E7C0E3E|nr:DUF6084 family protein [Streptomyces sp. TRM 70361]MEE1940203.1 DUF6084 family protein [Streptomyces sp. TRM 70361]
MPGGPSARHAVPSLSFEVTGAEPERFAAVPTLRFGLRITRTGGGPVRSVSLTTTVRIDVARRRHGEAERRALTELFGLPERWGTTLRPLVWTRITTVVPPFEDTTVAELPLPCTCDTELAVTKYLFAVRDGEVPLDFLFGGTVFFRAADGRLGTARISWSEGAAYRLPAGLWHGLLDRYFGGSPWLRLSRETYDRLDAHRTRQVLGTWDKTVAALLDRADGTAPGSGGPSGTSRTP